MAYATRQDLVVRFGKAAVTKLAADPDDTSIDRTVGALLDAGAIVDTYVGVRYVLPLPSGDWPVLRDAVCDIARRELTADRPIDEVVKAEERSRAQLAKIAEGKLRLVDAAGNEAPRLLAARARSNRPQFTPKVLGGVWP